MTSCYYTLITSIKGYIPVQVTIYLVHVKCIQYMLLCPFICVHVLHICPLMHLLHTCPSYLYMYCIYAPSYTCTCTAYMPPSYTCKCTAYMPPRTFICTAYMPPCTCTAYMPPHALVHVLQ